MGTINHDVIVVVGGEDDIAKLTQLAERCELVYTVGPTMTNGYITLTIVADGSKEGWGTSNHYDDARESFVAEMQQLDGWSDWAHIKMGEIDSPPRVVDPSYT